MSENNRIQRESAARKVYDTYWESYAKGDVETFASTLDDNFKMFGTSETEICHTKADGIDFLKGQIEEIVGKAELRNRQIDMNPVDTLMLVSEQCDIYVLIDQIWNFYSKVRISTLLKETTEGWKVAQQHGSVPDMRVQEGETLAIDKISKENIELRDAVKRRTAELEIKNRELEIEAALERVRARTMAMQSSDELTEVSFLLNKQVVDLGIPTRGCAFNIYGENESTEWFSNLEGTLPTYKTPREKFFLKYYEAGQRGETLFIEEYSGLKIKEHYKYLSSLTVLAEGNKTADKVNQVIPELQIDHVAYFKYGYLLFITLIQAPEAHDIFKRFAKEFEQTYTRFLDLQKAEAQARESEIQLALERVRAKALAMHTSDELNEVSLELRKQMGILGQNDLEVCAIHLYEEAEDYFESWGAIKSPYDDKLFLGVANFPKSGIEIVDEMMNHYSNGDKDYILVNKGPKAFEWFEIMKKHSPDAYELIHHKFENTPAENISGYWSISDFSGGALVMVTYTPPDEDSRNLLSRAASVFGLAYRRYKDLKNAEKQAREAEIQLALERVRARTMAMHKSEELSDTASIMFQELKKLGVNSIRTGVCIFDFDQDSAELWLATEDGNKTETKALGKVSGNMHPMYRQWIAAGANNKKRFQYTLSGKEVGKYYKMATSHLNLPKQKVYNKIEIYNGFLFPEGSINVISLHPLTEEEFEIGYRFANVFGLLYRRFLDLQKAEAQAREAQIEAALERVRTRTMTMHASDELGQVVSVVYKELAHLGIDIHLSLILIYDWKTKQMEWWSSGQGMDIQPQKYKIQILPEVENHPWLKRYFDAQKNNLDFEFYELGGEIKRTWDKYMLEKTDMKNLPEDFKQAIMSYESILLADAFMKHGVLSVSVTESLPDRDITMIKRFARVIDLTFSRFYDLKKAEAQAREAQIEAALERVRGRAMAIRKSDELREVVTLIFKELNHLGFDLLESNLLIFDPPSKDLIVWGTGPGETDLAVGTKLQYFKHPFLDELFKDIKAGNKFRSGTIGGKQLKSYFESLYTLTDFKNTPLEIIEANYKIPKVHYRQAIFNHGFLELIATEPISAEKEEILVRFAKVIDLTYTRFDDIVQAEKQAREAQIEAALERVRSRTMGMQKSSELQEVINRIFIEMTTLGVSMDSSYIITHLDQDMNKGFYAWVSINEQSYASKLHQAYLDHPVVHRFYKAWNEKEPHFAATFSKDEKNRYFSHQFKYSPQLSLIPEQRKKVILDGNGWSLSWTILKNAALILQRYQHNPFNEDEINIQKRFAKVFEQTYTRFLDLQKAEAQAKDALKQASLDRVRGEIASMRNSEDLNRITPVIWRELKALEVPFFRCGVFIFDEIKEKVRVYLSTPEGKAIAALNLSYNANELTKNTVDHWRTKRIFKTHWNKEDFINWTRSMMKIGQVGSAESYQGAADAPESLNLHFVPFRQGMLYVGDVNPLSNEKIDLVKNLSESFSIAYARYEDFKNLEDAKNKIEITLSELKAAQAQLIQAEKMASLGELTAGIAHEIQNPLNFVNNFSELSNEMIDEMNEELAVGNMQLANEIAGDIKQNLEKINHHGKRAADIVKGMLQHSRTSSGQKEPTDINALADEYLRLAYHGLKAKEKSFNAGFKTEFDPNLPKINVIPQDIGRVLLNLINNAFYAVDKRAKEIDPLTPEGGTGSPEVKYKPTVTVTTGHSLSFGEGRGEVKISVKDNGPGIPDSIKDKIFQPFFTTKPTGQGTGLGLSLSYDIVKAHGGELKMETKEGLGTEFTLILPA